MIKEIDRLLCDFLMESQENLVQLDQQFVGLEHDPDNEELLAGIFRAIHTMKGGAGFLKLTRLEQVAHHAEDVLAKLRDHSLTLNPEMITTLLSAADSIKYLLLILEDTGEEGDLDVQEVVMELKAAAEGKQRQEPGETSAVPVEPDIPERRQASAHSVPVAPQEDHHRETLLKNMEQNTNGTLKDLKSSETKEQAVSSVEDTRIHVDVRLLDQLMNLTGELVLSRNQVTQFATAAEIDRQEFRGVAQRMNTVVSELQETVMKTHMEPVKKVFGMLPRLVRDVSKMHGKEVQLRITGQENELDRTLIEAIKAPITHLVRNALDHGIELPDVRQEQGKSPTGTIAIRAYSEDGQVSIEVADDGAGIDLEQISAKAIQEEVMTRQQAEEMSERDLLNLLFRPGFTTAAAITDLSGRGVGMDVVRQHLDRIGGTVEIHTVRRQGTTVKLRIPLTLAIIPALVVMSANRRFAIPQVHLEELVMLERESPTATGIETVSGSEVYRLRGELLPLLRLSSVLQLPARDASQQNDISIVVLASAEARFGLIVDEVGDTEEIVVKPLSTHIKHLPCYDGATIMGDGGVALILNVGGLLSAAQLSLNNIQQIDEAERDREEVTSSVSSHEEQHQTIVLFRTGSNEYYGVPLAFVVRLEEFSASQIETSGGREVLQYRGDILPLMRLEAHLNLPSTPDPELLSLIVFSVEKPIGLVVHEVVNMVEISTHIDTETFHQQGVLGSTIVEGHSVLIVDIHGLIEMAYPAWYKQFFVSKISEAEREQTRVLLVEDSMFFLNIEQSYLEAAGYQVMTAQNGQEAQETLASHPVDVVVTDLDMPLCDGYELTKRIKAREAWKHIPVMALTALSGEDDRRKGLEAGVDAYHIKLDRDEVLSALEQLILRNK